MWLHIAWHPQAIVLSEYYNVAQIGLNAGKQLWKSYLKESYSPTHIEDYYWEYGQE